MYKLDKIGIKNKALNFFKSYLTNRKLLINKDGIESKTYNIKFGCPQGANISPIMFNIFINDIAKLKLRGRLTIFADDICIFYICTNVEQLIKDMQYDLELLHNWFNFNSLTMNINKTKFMIISRSKNYTVNNTPKINGIEIERVDCYKYLGLIIDEKLKWTEHIKYIKKKINPMIGVLWRAKGCMPITVRKNIYISLIQSHILYLISIWGSAYQTNLQSINVINNKALKIIYNFHWRKSTYEVYKETQTLSLGSLYKRNLCLLMFKIQFNLLKCNIITEKNSDIHHYGTRNADKLHITFNRTNLGKHSVLSDAKLYFNELPKEIRETERISVFKNELKYYLIEMQNKNVCTNVANNNIRLFSKM
jgi:uncharacterized protein YunC (DUF1805 family)